MAIMNGTNVGIYVGGSKVAHCTSASISISHSPREATSKDSGGWSDVLEGLREWSAEGEAFFDLAAAYGFTDLEGVMSARTQVTLRWSTETSGEEYFEGLGYLTDLSADSGVEESATFSFSFQGTGEVNYKALT
jgi:predicted secreted protein